jgi:hypothetical protein
MCYLTSSVNFYRYRFVFAAARLTFQQVLSTLLEQIRLFFVKVNISHQLGRFEYSVDYICLVFYEDNFIIFIFYALPCYSLYFWNLIYFFMLYSGIIPAVMQLYRQQGYLLSIRKSDIMLRSAMYWGVFCDQWFYIEYFFSNLLPVFLGFCFV